MTSGPAFAEGLFAQLVRSYPDTWQSLLEIQRKFAAHGFSLYLVGGAVRNLVLGLPLKDFDLATDALPEHILKMFRSVIPTGIQHGTVTLVYRRQHFEITTFRVDGAYTDARRPDTVSFTPDIREDLKRRDFTINAMALDLAGRQLIDPHQGHQDLVRHLIRTVGTAADRFQEDGLRIMRGLRFAAQLGFHIETATWEAMRIRLDRLAQVSVERFRDEIRKTLDSALPSRGLYLMRDLGALALFMPEITALDDAGFARACLMTDLAPQGRPDLRLAALLSPLAADPLRRLLARLRLSGAEIKFVSHLLTLLEAEYDPLWSDAELRRFASRAGRALARTAVDFHNLRAMARDWLDYNPPQAPVMVPVRLPLGPADDAAALDFTPIWSADLDRLRGLPDPRCQAFAERMDRTLADHPPLAIADLAVNGSDLQDVGIPPGPHMGRLLAELLEMVLREPAANQAADLLEQARRLYSEPNRLS